MTNELGYDDTVCLSCTNKVGQEIQQDGISMQQNKKPDPVVPEPDPVVIEVN